MEFIPFLVGDDNNSFLCYHVLTRHSFDKAPQSVLRNSGPHIIYSIIKKNLRSRMSFTPGNGISNEMPSNCGISIEVSRRTLSSLFCLSAVVVCAFVADVLCCCFDPVSFAYFQRQTAFL